jgi:hypothetical protein
MDINAMISALRQQLMLLGCRRIVSREPLADDTPGASIDMPIAA